MERVIGAVPAARRRRRGPESAGRKSNPDSALATPTASYGDAATGSPAYYRHAAVSQLDCRGGTSDADATRALPGNRHDEPSSPSPEPISVAILVTTLVGHFWKADPGHSPKAPKSRCRDLKS